MWRQGLFPEKHRLMWSTWMEGLVLINVSQLEMAAELVKFWWDFSCVLWKGFRVPSTGAFHRDNGCILASVHLNLYCRLTDAGAKADVYQLVFVCVSSFPTDTLGKLSFKIWVLQIQTRCTRNLQEDIISVFRVFFPERGAICHEDEEPNPWYCFIKRASDR